MLYSDDVFRHVSGAPRGFVQPHNLSGMPPDTPLLVGFSGGADSALLLRLCQRYAADVGARVYAAHLNHGIRGAEADRDEAFCRAEAERLGVPLFVGHADVPAEAVASGESLETAARRVRYAFFASVMTGAESAGLTVTYLPTPACPVRPASLPLLLTAHHADDQLETVLLRLLRGTGIKGLGGIPPVRALPAGRPAGKPAGRPAGCVIRPLLRCTKADILTACERLGQSYVTDSTNLVPDTTRNALRCEVIPALNRLAGDGVPASAALRVSDSAREDADCLDQMASAWYTEHKTTGGVPVTELNGLHPAISGRVLLFAYREAVCKAVTDAESDGTLPADRTLTAAHLSALRTLCAQARPHSEIVLPHGFCAVVGDAPDRLLTFSPPQSRPDSQTVPGEVPLHKGDNPVGGYIVRLEIVSVPYEGGDAPLAEGFFPASMTGDALTARLRRPGDRILCHGMHKSLRKLYCDRHVPLAIRDALPVICTPDGILWAPLCAFADGHPAPVSGDALRITVMPHAHDS